MGGAKNLASVLRHFRVHPVGPGQNPASEIMDLLESSLAQEVHSLGAAHTGAAVGHNFAAGVEFVDALGQIAQRDKISINVADLVLVRLADIEHENVFTGIEPTLQFLYLNFEPPFPPVSPHHGFRKIHCSRSVWSRLDGFRKPGSQDSCAA